MKREYVVISILLDNALKYCDEGGSVSLSHRKAPSYSLYRKHIRRVDNIELDKLFDRFYRADKARTFPEASGSVSPLQAIVENSITEINAYKASQGISVSASS